MASYTLRPATDDDYDFLQHVVALTMRPYVEQTWGQWDESLHRRFFRSTFTLDGYFVIIIDGAPAGGLWLQKSPQRHFLSRIQILPDYQGRGIGNALIRSLVEEAQDAGLPLELRVLKTNPNAQRLYERLGFVIFDETETHVLMRQT